MRPGRPGWGMDIDEALPGTEDCIRPLAGQRAVPPKPEAPPVMPRVRLTFELTGILRRAGFGRE